MAVRGYDVSNVNIILLHLFLLLGRDGHSDNAIAVYCYTRSVVIGRFVCRCVCLSIGHVGEHCGNG